jgi:hypothetical protein
MFKCQKFHRIATTQCCVGFTIRDKRIETAIFDVVYVLAAGEIEAKLFDG